MLQKNQKGIMNRESGEIKKQNFFHRNELAWYTRYIEFESAPLAGVIDVLCETYHTEIIPAVGIDTTQLITASFEKQSLDDVLDVIAKTMNPKIEKQHETLFYLKNK